MKKGFLFFAYSMVFCSVGLCEDQDGLAHKLNNVVEEAGRGVMSVLQEIRTELGKGAETAFFDERKPRTGPLIASAGAFAAMVAWFTTGPRIVLPFAAFTLLQYFAMNAVLARDILAWNSVLFLEVLFFTGSVVLTTKFLNVIFRRHPDSVPPRAPQQQTQQQTQQQPQQQ
jgi:hypothetical protein